MELLLGFFGFMFMLMRFGLRTVGENGYKKYVNDLCEKKKKYVEEHSDPELEQEYCMKYGINGDFRELYYLLLSCEDKIKRYGTRRDKIVYDLWRLESGSEFRLRQESAKEWFDHYKETMTKKEFEIYCSRRTPVDEFELTNEDYKKIVFAEYGYGYNYGISISRPMYILLSLHRKVPKYQAMNDAEDLFDDKKIKDIKKYGYRCLLMAPRKNGRYGIPEFEGIDEKFPPRYPEMFV